VRERYGGTMPDGSRDIRRTISLEGDGRLGSAAVSHIVPITWADFQTRYAERMEELVRSNTEMQARNRAREARAAVNRTSNQTRVERLKEKVPGLVGNDLDTEHPRVVIPLDDFEKLLLAP
jgi:hypothetical protein